MYIKSLNVARVEVKKNIKAILTMLALIAIFFSNFFQEQIIFYRVYQYSTKNYDKEIEFKTSYLTLKMIIDIISINDRDECRRYIYDKNMTGELFYKQKKISENRLNELPARESVIFKLFIPKELESKECKLQLLFFDPYGNMYKTLLFFTLPVLGMAYLIFKTIWLIIAGFIKDRKYLN